MTPAAVRRRPHPDPRLRRLGCVEPTPEEARAAQRAEAYVRSSPGTYLPPTRIVWAEGFQFIGGATDRGRPDRLPVLVIMAAGRSFEATFRSSVHELSHVQDAWLGGFAEAKMEANARARVAHAERERWRW